MTTLKSRIEDADMVANNFIDWIPNSGQCAVADLLGDCCITSYDCSVMLKSLVKVADGNIFLALEGGYNFNSLVNPVIACAKTLLEGNPVVGSFFKERPFESTWHVINKGGIKSIKIYLWETCTHLIKLVDIHQRCKVFDLGGLIVIYTPPR
ncbi:Histone deacetylase 5 [Dendrobium catenatum]|uniref:Histone deacetylase 5 n=1 Tax=Dendrobium catenatum TaxID=906689 RepID=A0A2I0VLH2_9ASPA|nr:Histone deacetylase 5 [Dendrobium catenatum]